MSCLLPGTLGLSLPVVAQQREAVKCFGYSVESMILSLLLYQELSGYVSYNVLFLDVILESEGF